MRKKTVIQKLEHLGFSLFASRPGERDLVENVGSLFVVNIPGESCGACRGNYLYSLYEIAAFQIPEIKLLFVRIPFFVRTYVDANRICVFCNSCGTYALDPNARRIGVLGGHLRRKGNIFRTLNEIESNGMLFSDNLSLDDLKKLEAYHMNRIRLLRRRMAALKMPYRDS